MRPGSSVRRQAEVFLLVLLLAGCAAATSRTNDDLTISTQVKIALLSDARLGGLRLEVKTFQGVVTLEGTVRSAADEQHAITLAKRTHGVRDVRSRLKVEAPKFSPQLHRVPFIVGRPRQHQDQQDPEDHQDFAILVICVNLVRKAVGSFGYRASSPNSSSKR
jgi:hypothetical protein